MTQDRPSNGCQRESRDISRRGGVWIGYTLLLAAGVPWYLPAAANRFLFGLPLWVEICLAGNVALALYTLWVIRRYWQAEAGD